MTGLTYPSTMRDSYKAVWLQSVQITTMPSRLLAHIFLLKRQARLKPASYLAAALAWKPDTQTSPLNVYQTNKPELGSERTEQEAR